jgi:predicted ABC-type ATPase
MSKDRLSKRMRVFAGPNGSGKSTIIKEITKKVRTGTYINADEIEKSAKVNRFINLGDYSLSSTSEQFSSYLKTSTLFDKARKEGYNIDLSLIDNVITIGGNTNSYEAALIADFLRTLLLEKGDTFTFETVMSHPGKLDTFKNAKQAGYKNYLYFVSTESVEINIRRVEEREAKGGHAVAHDKIKERYIRSMDLVS